MHDMLADMIHGNGAKGAHADMQRDEIMIDPGKHFRGEVQSCRRRGDRSLFLCEDGLIALLVQFAVLTPHVVR